MELTGREQCWLGEMAGDELALTLARVELMQEEACGHVLEILRH